MDGSATFTIVASSTIISIPPHSTYSASQRLLSALVSFVTLVVSVLTFFSSSFPSRSP